MKGTVSAQKAFKGQDWDGGFAVRKTKRVQYPPWWGVIDWVEKVNKRPDLGSGEVQKGFNVVAFPWWVRPPRAGPAGPNSDNSLKQFEENSRLDGAFFTRWDALKSRECLSKRSEKTEKIHTQNDEILSLCSAPDFKENPPSLKKDFYSRRVPVDEFAAEVQCGLICQFPPLSQVVLRVEVVSAGLFIVNTRLEPDLEEWSHPLNPGVLILEPCACLLPTRYGYQINSILLAIHNQETK